MADRTQTTDDERERLKEEIARSLTMDQIRVEPWYLDVRGEIVKPDQVQVTTKYFWSRWAAKLGPLGTVLLLRLRQYCYFNRATGEKRDWCYPSQQTLADELGIQKRHTIGEALRHLEAMGFVRREPSYRYDPVLRKKVRSTDKYFILMEDPIAPEDEPEAFVRAAERILTDRDFARGGSGSRPMAEKRPQVASAVDNPGPMAEKRPHEAGRKAATKNDFQEVLKNVNVIAHSEDDELRIAALTAELVESLHDPKSRNFYRLVAQRMPESLVFMTLSETKDAQRTGQIRKNAGAYFTHAIKAAAERIGVSLATSSPAKASK